jgi:hypothetical protein
VVKPGGKIIVVDYALPRSWHPPFATFGVRCLPDMKHSLSIYCATKSPKWLPRVGASCLRKTTFFGDLYQKVVITR